ncbi:MAG: glycosyl transferase family 28 [Fibrobacter sp.]|nr:glycosyl transferase family 28 [Fibrobacter sp.]
MKVLVAPLDWGLGHATRCIPVIREFLRQGAEVELAVVKSNAKLLRGIFPELRQRLAPSYNIVYPKHGYNMGLWLAKNGAHLNSVIRFEHRYVEEMVERHHYDVVLSDNRFGFYSRKAKSIYMTHQRRIAFPPALSALESVGMMWHASVMRHFDEVWVPDIPEEPGYAGNMSHVRYCPRSVRYVGALSRFENAPSENEGGTLLESIPLENPQYKFVAVVSGVEPARSRFEKKLAEAFAGIPGRHLIIQGRPAAGIKTWTEGNVDFCTHLQDAAFSAAVRGAEHVVSRGGYSTVMDMAVLGASCIFVPTPGQYEQVILGRNLARAGFAYNIDEKDLSAGSLLRCSGSMKLPQVAKNDLLHKAVSEVLKIK